MKAIYFLIIIIAIVVFTLFQKSRKPASPVLGKMPTQDEATKRAICLAVFLKRFQYEMVTQITSNSLKDAKPSDKEKFEKLQQELGGNNKQGMLKIQEIITKEGLEAYQSPKEKALINKPIGTWEKQDTISASWRKESLGVLLWSLSVIDEIPPYDQEFDDFKMVDIVLTNPTIKFYSTVKLRPKVEIQKARDIAEHWHWRSRTTQIIKQGTTPPKGYTFDQIIELSATGGFKDGMNPKPINNDFPLFGKAYKNLTDSEYSVATSIAVERHFGLNWLIGYSKDWDNTPTDT